MVFTSCTFLFLFFPATMLLYAAIRPSLRNGFLFLASLLFYAWGRPSYLVLLLGTIALNYLLALGIGGSGRLAPRFPFVRKALLWAAVCSNLSLLCLFKYEDFLSQNLNRLFGRELFPSLGLALPIGISFYIFQGLSYVIDVYRGETEAERNPISLGLYIAMFPQLVAGPIVRYVDIKKEILRREVSLPDAVCGIRRFTFGFAKKLLLADTLGYVADQIFALEAPALIPSIAWLGAVCYTFQIYYDFSGYSDMAIGMGRMLGFHFRENFSDPYFSKSVTEFWRRWHISLSGWFRDYLYIPLGGNRRGNVYLHLLIVFMVTGLWHGAAWKFAAWGLWHGIFLMAERLWRQRGAVSGHALQDNVMRRDIPNRDAMPPDAVGLDAHQRIRDRSRGKSEGVCPVKPDLDAASVAASEVMAADVLENNATGKYAVREDKDIARNHTAHNAILQNHIGGFRSFACWLYTMLVVLLGWVLFRAESLRAALVYIKAMFGLRVPGFIPFKLGFFLNRRALIALCFAALFAFPLLPLLSRFRKRGRRLSASSAGAVLHREAEASAAGAEGARDAQVEVLLDAVSLLLFALSILFLISGSYNAFIYFQF